MSSRSVMFGCVIVSILLSDLAQVVAQTHPGKVGIGLEGIGGRGLEFVDVARTTRTPSAVGGGAVGRDAAGWPTADFETVLFDMRPVAAWEGVIDDPQQYQIDVTGTYKMSFNGQADLSVVQGSFSIANKVYNSSTNTTTADLVVNGPIVIIRFSNTRRTGSSSLNSGITNLKVTRPGYAHNTTQLFHTPFINALNSANFAAIRYMDWTHANNNNATYPATNSWGDRPLMSKSSDAIWGDGLKMDGAPWETVVLLGNQVNKDIWINVPVSANDDYITKLAQLLRYGSDGVNPYTSAQSSPLYPPLNSTLNIYVELSNEVWNSGFTQQAYAASAGQALGITEHQWVARRTAQIRNLFAGVFGSSAINGRIRVVLCNHAPMLQWWVQPQLEYINNNFGAPSNYIYMIARQGYFSPASKTSSDTVATLLEKARQDIDNQNAVDSTNNANRSQWIQKGTDWALVGKAGIYEGGPHFPCCADMTVLANEISANRASGMGDLLRRNWGTMWADLGGTLGMHFTLSSGYNRYGCWGLTDDITNPDRNFKFQAIRDLVGSGGTPTQPPAAPTNLVATAGDAQVSLTWSASSGATSYNVKRSTTSGSGYTTIASPTTTSYTNTGLTNGTTYYYVVSAVNSAGESDNSNQASATPQATPGGSGTISQEIWTGIAGNEVSLIPVNDPPSQTGSLTSLEGPTNWGDSYGQRVRGYLTAPQTGSYTFWIASDDYSELWLSTSSNPANKVLIASVTGWTNSREWNKYTSQKSSAISLTAGGKYYIEALQKEGAGGDNLAVGWAKPGQGTTAPSEVIPGSALSPWDGGPAQPPAAPANLVATAGNAEVSLTWSASSGATSYNVKRSTTSGGPYASVVTGVTTTSYTNTGLTNGTTYYYVVSAVNSAGESGNSNQASATPTAPSADASIAAGTATIDGTIDSAWSNATAYTLGNTLSGTMSAGDLTVTWKGLWDSTNLYVLAEVTDDVKNNDSTNAWDDDSVEVYVDGNNDKATSYDANDAQYVYGWNDSAVVGGTNTTGSKLTGVTFAKTDPSSTSYRIETKIPWSSLGVTASSGKIIGIDVHVNDDDDGTTRDGKKSWKATTDSSWTDPSTFGTASLAAGSTPQPPAAPTGLAATAGNGQVSLSWNASSGATSYNVKRSTTSGSGYTTIASPTTTSYTNTGLTNGTTYYYVVSAVNSNGESGNSAEVSATPQAPASATSMHVSSIAVTSVNAGGGKKRGQAQVTILDNLGNPVSGATVTGTFSGSLNESGRTGTTNSSGVATISTSGTAKGGVNFTFCVNGVTHSTLTYNSAANVETCDSGS